MHPKKLNGQKSLPGLVHEIEAEATRDQRPKGMPSMGEIKTEVARVGLEDRDAEHLFDCWLENGFTLRGGKPVKNWRATIRIWQRLEYFPSQRKQKFYRNDTQAERRRRANDAFRS